MNRAIRHVALPGALIGILGALPGQAEAAGKKSQPDAIAAIVTEIRQAEQALRSVRIELATFGSYPADLEMRTSGSLHVLRGAQPRLRTVVRMSYSNGLTATMESLQTADGVTFYKDDPAFGEVFVRVGAAVVADLEWAGEVLDRSDLPGMKDARAAAPLGSAMLESLRREFDLTVATDRTNRGEDEGRWLVGKRRVGLADVAGELPLADRAEIFVRNRDHAVLDVVQYQGDQVLHRIDVTALAVDEQMAPSTFQIDGRGQPLREVDTYVPLWSLIQDVLGKAEAKRRPEDLPADKDPPPETLRPSRRSKKAVPPKETPKAQSPKTPPPKNGGNGKG
ncbi:MAG: hypothetical protein NXI31_23230 [bacterium]|nr:hypothetical protein [bacterium]